MSHAENPLKQLERFGQSVWLDYIRRNLLTSVEFKHMLNDDGLKGMTSNPTIFEKAIAGSNDYDAQFRELVARNKNIDEIYEALSIADIQQACDALRPVYDRSGGRTGFVSYEVSPMLANDTDATIKAARRYAEMIGRPNLMIKVPSTPAGIPAIEQLISEGRNINITLMFSMKHYDTVAEAYIRGLERRLKAGGSVDRVASVASVFVSRIDTLVDKKLDGKLKNARDEALVALKGRAAVANTKLIYQRFKEIFYGDRFAELARAGAYAQRPLWASTGTKNPAYSDIKYVQELISPDTVNTMPPATMDAFRDRGQPRLTLEEGLDDARRDVERLRAAGIDLDDVGEELQKEGVELFAKSFEDLLAVITGRRQAIVLGAMDRQKIAAPGYEKQSEEVEAGLDKAEFPSRLWRKDASLWKKDAAAQKIINNAMGWLRVPEMMAEQAADLKEFANSVRGDGIKHVVLLGMGGSSLCPEVFARTFSNAKEYPKLHVLDSTVPDWIRSVERAISPKETLFIVSSKSGGTIETLSQYRYFLEIVRGAGVRDPGRNFVAITDAGSGLEKIGRENNFRRVFLNPSDIGGRYSALSYFGLAPAALIGMDIDALLDRAIRMTHSSAGCIRVGENAGVGLGAFLGAMQKERRDKVTFIASPAIGSFGLWVEQLIAESTGKEGTGIVPICDEPVGAPSNYGNDRVFAYLRFKHGVDEKQERGFEALQKAGFPTALISVEEKIDLGEEFMRWEIATATAGSVIGINAFDQPNVQESKDNTNRLLAEFEKTGKLPAPTAAASKGSIDLFVGSTVKDSLGKASDFDKAMRAFLGLSRDGDYFATMAYVTASDVVDKEIAAIRSAVRDRNKIATTFGYGPRFLHSTGQLHKGGPNIGLFLQITQEHRERTPIPGQKYDFAQLNQAQHLGDFQALEAHGRRVVRVHLRGDVAAAIASLRESIVAALA